MSERTISREHPELSAQPAEVAERQIPMPPPHVWVWRRLLRYGPGILALVAVGYLALLSSYFLAGLQYVPMAILLGAFVSNTFGVHESLEKGISTYELWLKAGIVLLGSQVAADTLGLFWLKALPLAALTVLCGMGVLLVLGRLLRLPPRLTALLAAGTGICGVSAIVHTAPAIGADDEEIEYAVGAVLAIGAAAIVLYPILGHLLHLSQSVYGLWTGLSVNNTAEAVATGYSYGGEAGRVAIASKLCRVVMLGAAVSLLAAWTGADRNTGVRATAGHLWQRFPKFVLMFFLVAVLTGLGLLSDHDRESLRNVSSWLFLLAFAGIGFKLRWADIRTVGPRPIVAISLGSLALGTLTLAASAALSAVL
ncbi:MAG: YeiH family protein, partial [Chloroflexota bacterium]|nr:YeiH family protein [Chloroflexota bacterium]